MTEIEKSPLQELADRANEEHRSCERTFRFALGHAMRAGDALNEVKELLTHGQWLPWLEENFEGSIRVAQTYMRLAKHRDELANTQNSAHLSIDAALKELAAPKPETVEEETEVLEALEAEMEQDFDKRVAEMRERSRAAEERHREQRRKNHGLMFMEASNHLSRARRELKKAVEVIRDVEFDKEGIELLAGENEAVQAMLELVRLALTGDSGTDWDAELAALEHKREYGGLRRVKAKPSENERNWSDWLSLFEEFRRQMWSVDMLGGMGYLCANWDEQTSNEVLDDIEMVERTLKAWKEKSRKNMRSAS